MYCIQFANRFRAITWRFGRYSPSMTGTLHFVRIYGKPGLAVISDKFISWWVNYFPKEWNMFSNHLPIIPSHGRIGFWETNNYFILGFFSPKKENVLRNSTPCISLRRTKYVISGGSIVSEQVGSKGGTAQNWGPTPFFFNFAPIFNHVRLKVYMSFSLSHQRSYRFTDIKSH